MFVFLDALTNWGNGGNLRTSHPWPTLSTSGCWWLLYCFDLLCVRYHGKWTCPRTTLPLIFVSLWRINHVYFPRWFNSLACRVLKVWASNISRNGSDRLKQSSLIGSPKPILGINLAWPSKTWPRKNYRTNGPEIYLCPVWIVLLVCPVVMAMRKINFLASAHTNIQSNPIRPSSS